MRFSGTFLNSKKPFARLQFVMLAGLFMLTGVFVTNKIFAATGTMTFVPSAGTVNIGDTVSVSIRENSGVDAINAVQANISFDATRLQYMSVSETGSAFGLVAATEVSTGRVNFARGTQGGSAPVVGDNLVTTITFKALAAGSVPLTFVTGSALVRSSDNTNILAVSSPFSLVLLDNSAPSTPLGLAAPTITMNSVGLTWAASTDNVGTTGYHIYRNGVVVGNSQATNFTDTGLLANTAYSYSVASMDAAGNVSAQTAAIPVRTLADTIAPSIPSQPIASASTTTTIQLIWTASTDNVAVTGYKIFRNGAQVGTSVGNTFIDANLNPDTIYSYTLSAIDSSGNVSAQSLAVQLRTPADVTEPSVPQGLAIQATGQTLNLTWTASTDNTAVAGYLIYRDGVQIATSVLPKITIQNALAGSHAYSVAAVDTSNNISFRSAEVTVIVSPVGDINHDGKVDVFDLSTLLNNWAHTGINSSDLNSDSVVNIFDLSILLSHWTG